MEEVTQEKVDEAFSEAKKEWDRKVAESGHPEHMFVFLDRSGFVGQFLTEYQMCKEMVESSGLVMPELIPGLEISVTDQE